MSNLVLAKESGNTEIKRYFEVVLRLSKSGKQFPIDLDDVWMLVYSYKQKAVQALQESGQFYEGTDYEVFTQKVENPNGGRPTEKYMLSVPCLEYLIARKVRAVFEVYRQVFHRTADNLIAPQDDGEIIAIGYAKALDKIREQRMQILKLKGRLTEFRRSSEEYKERRIKMLIAEREKKTKSVSDFINDSGMVASDGEKTSFREIWSLYCAWCNRKGVASVTERTLGRALRAMDFDSVRRCSGMFYSVKFSE